MGLKVLPPFKLSVSKENISSFSLKVIMSTEPPLGAKQIQLIASKFVLKSRGHPAPPPPSRCLTPAVACLSALVLCLSLSLPALPPVYTNAFQPLASSSSSASHALDSNSQSMESSRPMCCLLPPPLQAAVKGGRNPGPRSVHRGILGKLFPML